MKVYHATLPGNAPIYLGEGARELLGSEIEEVAPDRVFIVTDRTVESLYLEDIREELPRGVPAEVLVINEGEVNKNLANLEHLAGDMLRAGITDRSLVVNVGGGMVLNMGGLAASLVCRGVPFAHVATTFTAGREVVASTRQVVNFVGRRNALGVQRSPLFSIVDPYFLESEPERHVRASLVGFVKIALVLGGGFYDAADRALSVPEYFKSPAFAETLTTCIEQQLEIGKRDPDETEVEAVDCYGATGGRALEILAEGRLMTNEAHYYGMRLAAELARAAGLLEASEFALHQQLLDKLAIDTPLPPQIRTDRFVFQLHGNNKTLQDNLPFMLLAGVGRVAGESPETGLRSRVMLTDVEVATALEKVRETASV